MGCSRLRQCIEGICLAALWQSDNTYSRGFANLVIPSLRFVDAYLCRVYFTTLVAYSTLWP